MPVFRAAATPLFVSCLRNVIQSSRKWSTTSLVSSVDPSSTMTISRFSYVWLTALLIALERRLVRLNVGMITLTRSGISSMDNLSEQSDLPAINLDTLSCATTTRRDDVLGWNIAAKVEKLCELETRQEFQFIAHRSIMRD